MDEMIDAVEEAVSLYRNRFVWFGAGVGAVVGALTGVYVGYKTSMKILEPKYAAIADEEIAEAKAFYKTLHKGGELSTPAKAAEKLLPESMVEATKALTRYQGDIETYEAEDGTIMTTEMQGPGAVSDKRPDPSTIVVESTNVFEEALVSFDWNHEVEISKRNSAEPYVVHEDEWSEGLPGYNRVTLTWYEGDDTLADEKDQPIPTVDDTVGLSNLERFGHGTGDARTVFIRNERLQIDFEVLKHDGKYAHEVLGFQHGELLALRDSRKTPRFRSD